MRSISVALLVFPNIFTRVAQPRQPQGGGVSIGSMRDPASVDPGRIAGLDAWRALLMSAGLFVHGSLWLPATPLFSVIGDVSQAFRMGEFYAISGFLTSLALERRDSVSWLQNRLIQLGVPALFGLAALSPLIWYTAVSSHGAAFGSLLPFEWHHLWYLFGLMLYSVVAVALHRTDRRLDLIRRLDRFTDPRSGRIVVLMVAFVSACLLGAAQRVMLVSLPPEYIRSFGNIQFIAGYLPIFLLGFVLARSHRLRTHFIQSRNFGVAICACMVAAYAAAYFSGSLAPLAKYVQFVAAALCPPAAFLIVLRSALTIRRIPALVKHVSGASYTI